MFRARQKLGKYRIVSRIASGPLANVYRAFDTIHKSHVALKIPKSSRNISEEDFLHEVQVAVKLKHPHILAVQNASFIDEHFVIAMDLGKESLADRIERRISTTRALDLAEQALNGLAYAHEHNIIHCDIKPENFILFDDQSLKLADFGFAKISLRTLKASGSGTIDYIAPEQAMGRPKFQSDVFSIGLVLYRMFSGKLPEWPYEWPLAGHDRLKARYRPEFAEFLKKAIEIDPKKRYEDAIQMYNAFEALQSRARRQRRTGTKSATKQSASWQQIRWREFQRRFKKVLDTRHQCRRCEGPVSESMHACPWCGFDHPSRGAVTDMPAHCPRCERGVKLDWDYCAFCYGPGFEAETNRHYVDKRYTARCGNSRCREPLMPFMRYCPWCRTKVKRPWKIEGSKTSCKACKWGICAEFWNFCAWCREPVKRA
ncbi:MAG: serine/threonine-protein kinase [Woeseia sp.]